MLARLEIVIAAVVGIGAVVVAVGAGDGDLVGNVVGALDDGVHVDGQVGALTAGAGDDDDRHVGEALRLAHDRVGVVVDGGLGQGPVLRTHGHGGPLGGVVGVDLGQIRVGGKACLGKGLEDSHGGGAVGGTGAGAAQDGIGGAPAEDVDGRDPAQGQKPVVLDEDETLLADLLDDILAGVDRLLAQLRLGSVQHAGDVVLERSVAHEVRADRRDEQEGQHRVPADQPPRALLGFPRQDQHDDHGEQGDQDDPDVAFHHTDVGGQVGLADAHGPEDRAQQFAQQIYHILLLLFFILPV